MKRTEMRNPNTMHIDRMETLEMLNVIHEENRLSVEAVQAALGQVAKAVDAVAAAFEKGGRLIYVGAGTSGRIAVMDAAECPPTFGVDYDRVIAVLAGGEKTLVRAAENEEDREDVGREEILARNVTENDVVMGISASGGAAFVAGALAQAKQIGCVTVSLSSNSPSRIGQIADIEIFADTGAEAITGSTRLKAGNSQKFVMNMITTGAMIKTGKVYENLMINLRPTNEKLTLRVVSIVRDITGCDEKTARDALDKTEWNIRNAVALIQG